MPKIQVRKNLFIGKTRYTRKEEQLTMKDAVRWMVPDASKAKCSEEIMAKSIQEFCQKIAMTRGDRKNNENEE